MPKRKYFNNERTPECSRESFIKTKQMKIAFFDLETTGTSITKDRIVEIAIAVIDYELRDTKEYNFRINPEIPIPAEATAVHGITNEEAGKHPAFRDMAATIVGIIDDLPLGGHNIRRFDIPFLQEELGRCAMRLNLENRVVLDTYEIEKHINGHDLSSVYFRRTGKPLVNAHGALPDTMASAEVFTSQFHQLIEANPEKQMTPEQVEEIVADRTWLDAAGYIAEQDNKIIYTFGKHKGKEVKSETSYAKWMLSGDFPEDTKRIIRSLI